METPNPHQGPQAQAKVTWQSVVRVLGVGVLVLALAPVVLLWILAVAWTEGKPFAPADARRVVAEQRHLLDRVLLLSKRSPLPAKNDPECQSLARELGALEIRFEALSNGPWAQIVYCRFGSPAETYEYQLAWTAEGDRPIGEYREPIEQGWWWVHW